LNNWSWQSGSSFRRYRDIPSRVQPFVLRAKLVTPLLRLTYKHLTSLEGYQKNSVVNDQVFVNPSTDTMDLDDAYYEARDLFSKMYGDEDFLIREDAEDLQTEDN
jgi:hypothetical protein